MPVVEAKAAQFEVSRRRCRCRILGERVRQSKFEIKRAVFGDRCDAALTACGFVLAADHHELIATRLLPLGEPVGMRARCGRGVLNVRRVELSVKAFFGAEAQPHFARSVIGLQGVGLGDQHRSSTLFLVKRVKPLAACGRRLVLRRCAQLGNGPLRSFDPKGRFADESDAALLDAVDLAFEPDRDGVELSRGDAESSQVARFEAVRGHAVADLCEQRALDPAVACGVLAECGVLLSVEHKTRLKGEHPRIRHGSLRVLFLPYF